MKKFLVLTAVLALAACGGGSGGDGRGHAGGAVPAQHVVPVGTGLSGAEDFIRSGFISDATNTSNGKVTSMTSAVVVAKDGSGSAIRSAVMAHKGKEYAVYELDDVKLRLADIAAEDGYLKIGLDNDGRINKMTVVLGEEADGSPIGGSIARVSDNNARFNGPIFEYVKDKYAKFEGLEFSVLNTTDDMKAKLAEARHFAAGEWVDVGEGVLKYRRTDNDQYEQFDSDNDGTPDTDFSVDNTETALKAAIKVACNFDDGKWVENSGNLKYVEYGDEAEYRVAATDSVTKDTLDDIVANNTRLSALELGHWNRVDEVMDIVSLGKDIDGQGTSLQFSDFGHFNPVYTEKLVDLIDKTGGSWNAARTKNNTKFEEELAGEDYQLFAGGYAISGTTLKDTLDAPLNTTFKGKAVGRVYVSFQSNGIDRDGYLETWHVPYDDGSDYSPDAGHDIAKTFTTTNATMTIDASGKQTLKMPFAGFYTVQVEKNGNNPASYTFNGTPTDLQYEKNNAHGEIKDAFKPGYYGVNTATEAAGTVYYATEQNIGDPDKGHNVDDITRKWEFQAAYGMTK